MPPGEALNDDYVASLLLRDADAHKKGHFSSTGIGTTSKRRPDAPKPNTTFLRHIIRDTDSHNAALKAREETESRARMRDLLGSGGWIGGDRKRKSEEDASGRPAKPEKRRKDGEREGRWAAALGGLGAGASKKRRSDRDSRDEDTDKMRSSRHGHHRHNRRSRSRSKNRRDSNEKRDRHRKSNRHQSRSHSPDHGKEIHRRRHRRRSRSRSRSPRPDRSPPPPSRSRRRSASASDSDPLDEFIGPKPVHSVLPRGRGAFKPSEMDSRFRPDYDPKTDVGLDDEDVVGNDWDMALEALRDRAKWRTKGADRLRAAGFTDDEITKFEGKGTGNGEQGVEDFKWAKKGESREWDRGKAVDESGELRLKPDWA